MKSYRRGLAEGMIISIFFYVFILDAVLEILADAEFIGPLKEYTYNDLAYQRDRTYVYGKGLDPKLDLPVAQVGNYSTHLPIASLYRAEPVLDLTADIIDEICIAAAYYDSPNNPIWEAAIRFKDKDLLENIARQHTNNDVATKEAFSLFRLGGDATILQMGRFSLDTDDNFSAKQKTPNHGDMHIFFGGKDMGSIADKLILLSPTHKILPCSDNIDMVLYNLNRGTWQPLAANFMPMQ